MDDVVSLVEKIYHEIESRNNTLTRNPIPQSDEFTGKVASLFNLDQTKISELIQTLVNSFMIFSFDTVDENIPLGIKKVEGYALADGPLLERLKKACNEELELQYTNQFTIKLSCDKIRGEVASKWEQFNNTDVGRVFRMSIMLERCSRILEREIMKYGKRSQEKQFAAECAKLSNLESYLKKNSENKDSEWIDVGVQSAPAHPSAAKTAFHEKNSDGAKEKEADLKNPAFRATIEKTIRVYGVEFYSRTCFKNYQFSLMQKIIAENLISGEKNLSAVKEVLRKVRSNSDKDENLQKYAAEINQLDKMINEFMKR
ncbi:MAG: hypothetical protein ACRCUT_04625 [Spirochaetota bacterium]